MYRYPDLSVLYYAYLKIYIAGKGREEESTGKTKTYVMDNIKMDFRLHGLVWTVLVWLRIGSSGRLL
jgi:hypothetical protein